MTGTLTRAAPALPLDRIFVAKDRMFAKGHNRTFKGAMLRSQLQILRYSVVAIV
jgi:hypothetical protein